MLKSVPFGSVPYFTYFRSLTKEMFVWLGVASWTEAL